MLKFAKVNGVKRGKITYDKNNCLAENVVSIVIGIPTNSISNHMKYIDIPRSTKYKLFKKVV